MQLHYYNEQDTFAADWLENLIKEGLIPNGFVDRRSIADVQAEDLDGFSQVHFFAGIAGWPLALRIAGWPEDRAIWTGSCPCQPFSTAGKGKAQKDERHLWPEMFRLIGQRKPDTIIGEQVASAIGRGWLDGISEDLEREGYSIGAIVLGAFSVGSPHRRSRLFWVADSGRTERGWRMQSGGEHVRTFHVADGGAHDIVGNSEGIGRNAKRIGEHSTERNSQQSGVGSVDDKLAKPTSARCKGRENVGAGTSDGGAVDGRRVESKRGMSNGKLGNSEHGRRCGREPQRSRTDTTVPSSHWDEFRIVPCSDGKSRRVGTSVSPLANGIPRELGRGIAELSKLVRSARANRCGRLRGYGNAIVPQIAAEFIKAFMDC